MANPTPVGTGATAVVSGVSGQPVPIAVALPSGVIAGDTLITICIIGDSGQSQTLGVTPPAGWSTPGTSGVDFAKTLTFYYTWYGFVSVHTAGSSEPSSYTFNVNNIGGGCYAEAFMLAFRGGSGTIGASAIAAYTSGATFTLGSLTPTTASDVWLGVTFDKSSTTPPNLPSGFTNIGTQSNSTNYFSARESYKNLTSLSATGTATAASNGGFSNGSDQPGYAFSIIVPASGTVPATNTATGAGSITPTVKGAATSTLTAAGSSSISLLAAGTALATALAVGAASISPLGTGSAVATNPAAITAKATPYAASSATSNLTAAGAATLTPTAIGAVSNAAQNTANGAPTVSPAATGSAVLTLTATGAASVTATTAGAAASTLYATGSPSVAPTAAGSAQQSGTNPAASLVSVTPKASGAATSTLPAVGNASISAIGAGQVSSRNAAAGQTSIRLSASGKAAASLSASGIASAAMQASGTAQATLTAAGAFSVIPSASGLISPQAIYSADGQFYAKQPAAYFYAASAPSFFYAPQPATYFYALASDMTTPTFSAKHPASKRVATFDATANLASGETLTSIISTTVTVIRGTDPNPSAVVAANPAPTINATQITVLTPSGPVTIASGSAAQCNLTGGLDGTWYLISFVCTTSNPNKVLTLEAILPVSAQP